MCPLDWLKTALIALFGWLITLLGAGCAPNSTELERMGNRLITDVIQPAVAKAIDETSVRTATLQGGGQVIEPGYDVAVEGFFGTGIKGRCTVRVVGVSGQITGHAQADQGQAAIVEPPANREDGDEPAGNEPAPVATAPS